MASRYPLVVNTAIPRLEELKGIDDLNLSNSLIELNNGLPTAANQIPRYDGSDLSWISGNTFVLNVVPDLVRTAVAQTITNKTIDGGTNTLQNIPNTSLVNDFITIGGTQIFLGDSVSALDTDTKYELGATGSLNLVTLNLQAYDVSNNTLINPTPNGDTTIKVVGSGASSVAWNPTSKTLTISSTDTDTNTTYSPLGTGGLTLSGTSFSIKNSTGLSSNRLPKWNTTLTQLENSNISDTGTEVSTLVNTRIGSLTAAAVTLTTTGDLTIGKATSVVATPTPTLVLRDYDGSNVLSPGNATIQVRLNVNASGNVLSDTRFFYDASTGTEGWRIDDQDNNLHYVNHISSAAAPATATSTGRPGQIRFDAGFIYLCISNNNWIRATRVAF